MHFSIDLYDIRNGQSNDFLLDQIFKNPPSLLPLMNLGEICFILRRINPALALLDMSIKNYARLEPSSMLRYIAMTILASVMQNQEQT